MKMRSMKLSALTAVILGSAVMVTSATAQTKGIYHDGWIDLNKNGQKDVYEDASKPIDVRVSDLIARMNVNEKTMQLVTLYGYKRVLKDAMPTEAWDEELWKDGLANIDEQHNGIGGGKEFLWPASEHTEAINETQRWFVENTRLGIPVDFTNEGIRGICHAYATNFPSQLAVGATWDRDLVRRIGEITGYEGHALGYTHVYSPILDVPRDQRWGRVVETYSESPYLVSELGVAQAKGLRKSDIGVTAKHFAVYSTPNGGRDGHSRTDPHVAPREMEMIHLYPFEKVMKEVKLQGVMSSYNDWDGVAVSGSSPFLQTLLRDSLGFDGYVVSDSDAVVFMKSKHKVAKDYKEAVRQYIAAGGNVRTTFNHPKKFVNPLRELIQEGALSMDVIDSRVADVLKVKFDMGLFDQPYRDGSKADALVANPAHKKVSLEAARKSIVLLKNEDSLLPLKAEKLSNILITGPNAEETAISRSRYGPKKGEVVSVLDGIRHHVKENFGDKVQVTYERGSHHYDGDAWPRNEVLDTDLSDEQLKRIERAVQAAEKSDVVIAVVGDNEGMVGESRSRTSLNLPPSQKELLKALHKTGKPVVVVLLSGRPVSINWADAHMPAIMEAWFGGEFMGTAVADVLFGDYNPGGKLAFTFPRTVGQIPMNFPNKPGAFGGQGKPKDPNGTGNSRIVTPLYPFGYGLSYTSFDYNKFEVKQSDKSATGEITVKVKVKNTGKVAGDEIVQLYVRDRISTVTTYEKMLRGFERVHLKPGQSKTITFKLKPEDDFWLIDQRRHRIVEPGDFEIMVGASSQDIKAKKRISIEGETLDLGPSFYLQMEKGVLSQ